MPHTTTGPDDRRDPAEADGIAVVPDLVPSTRAEPRARRALPRAYDAILLASFGGPEHPDEVMPFLRNVTRGRGVPDERLEAVSRHYMALGGRSPLNDQNRRLLEALRAELSARGIDLPVHWGNRNWHPTMPDAVRRLYAEGHRSVLAIATSAYSSYSSCRQYREDFGTALVETGLLGRMEIHKVRPFFDLPGFLEPTVDGVLEAMNSLLEAGHAVDRQHILFSTHSIPTAMADASGPEDARGDVPGGWYVAQHEAACRHVMAEVARRHGDGSAPPWDLVYQSRSGPPQVPWLEPDINDAIAQIGGVRSADAVIVVPIGFVSDHVEVIWDLDTEAKESAADQGLDFRRVPTAGTDPRTVSALADLVVERLDSSVPRAAATTFGGTPDVCGAACCHSGARDARVRPTTSALDSAEDVRAAAVTR